mmetsp:Transcript_8974/g.18123  ORF Transcript_8974/g.18123 Transcript_8974/m.18123 type:complete len:181 (+) Transcript_8974:170-712(+)
MTKPIPISAPKTFLLLLLLLLPIISTSFNLLPSLRPSIRPSTTPLFGILDDLKLIFSEEGKAKRREYEERQIKEQQEALRQIKERRKDPKKMEEYFQDVGDTRRKLREEREMWNFQQDTKNGEDPKKEWDRLRASGKITVGSEMARDKSTSRLGSEGLVEVRTDERMPYIDQGWVEGKDE